MTFLRAMAATLPLAFALAACGSEPDHVVDLGEVVGGWTVTLTEPPACGRDGEDTVALQGQWGVGPITNPTLDLLGRLDLRNGEFHADLTGTQPNLVGRLEGTMGLGEGLNGTFTDPAPGAEPLLGTGSCTYDAFGQH